MILLIYGSRSITDKEWVHRGLDKFLNAKLGDMPSVVISGKANGPDTFGELWALAHGIPVVPFYPLWNELGKRAGFLRNKQMALACTHAIGFWDGVSRGTSHMTDLLTQHDITPYVVLTTDEGQGVLEL